jgi:hypothetical protein
MSENTVTQEYRAQYQAKFHLPCPDDERLQGILLSAQRKYLLERKEMIGFVAWFFQGLWWPSPPSPWKIEEALCMWVGMTEEERAVSIMVTETEVVDGPVSQEVD